MLGFRLKEGDVVSARLWNTLLNTLIERINIHDTTLEQITEVEQDLLYNSEWIFDGGTASSELTVQHTDATNTVYTTSNPNVNPSKLFGGTWDLIGKSFKSTFINCKTLEECKGYITFNENAEIFAASLYCMREGSTVRLRIRLKSKSQFKDTTKGLQLCAINFKELGFERMPMGYSNIPMYCDASNAGLLVTLTYDTGELTQTDVVGRLLSGNVTEPTNQYYNLDITTTINQDDMIDSFCNRFHWERQEVI
jgi:hypothetical protein